MLAHVCMFNSFISWLGRSLGYRETFSVKLWWSCRRST